MVGRQELALQARRDDGPGARDPLQLGGIPGQEVEAGIHLTRLEAGDQRSLAVG